MIFQFLDFIGTLVFAISGAIKAIKYELDVFGVIVLSIVTGIGGGILRDLLLNQTLAAILNPNYILICVLGAILSIIAKHRIAKHWDLVLFFDTIGLGFFTTVGILKTNFIYGPIIVALMATLTSSGGSSMRDLLVGEIPIVLKNDLYATLAFCGGILFYYLKYFLSINYCVLIVMLSVIITRFLVMKFKIDLPKIKSMNDSPSTICRKHKNKMNI